MASDSLGPILRQVREEQGISLREMARRAGISAVFLCDVERSRRSCSDEVLLRLVNELGPSVEQALGTDVGFLLANIRQACGESPEMAVFVADLVHALRSGRKAADLGMVLQWALKGRGQGRKGVPNASAVG